MSECFGGWTTFVELNFLKILMDFLPKEKYEDSQLEHTDLQVLHRFVILNLCPVRNPLLCVESAWGTPWGTPWGTLMGQRGDCWPLECCFYRLEVCAGPWRLHGEPAWSSLAA